MAKKTPSNTPQREAVAEMLKSPDDPPDLGVAIPPSEKDYPVFGES